MKSVQIEDSTQKALKLLKKRFGLSASRLANVIVRGALNLPLEGLDKDIWDKIGGKNE